VSTTNRCTPWRSSRLVTAALDSQRRRLATRTNSLVRERVQLFERLPNQLPRPQPGVHQSLDRAKARELLGRVLALGVFVAARTRKAVAPLPDAEHILRQSRFPLDGADVEVCVVLVHAGEAIRPGQPMKISMTLPWINDLLWACPRQTGMLYLSTLRGVQRW
jgi:hypothetical protein